MGDIAFNIFKDVNLNKTVTLDIDKNVTVNVDNPDQLATAEADAEAFGPYALAEVDAYTVVTPPDIGPPVPFEGFVDILGNTVDFVVGPDELSANSTPGILEPGSDGAADTLTIVFDGDGAGSLPGDPPDLDDINASGALAPLDGDPPGNDVDLPDDRITITDFELEQLPVVTGGTPEGNLLAQYGLSSDATITFLDRSLDLNGDGVFSDGNLTLLLPEGTEFIAEYLGPGQDTPIAPPDGPIEIAFEAFAAGAPGLWLFSNPAEANPDTVDGSYLVTSFVFEAESLNAGQQTPLGIGDWALQATGEFLRHGGGDGGTAFAYAESTSALDLNPFGPTPI